MCYYAEGGDGFKAVGVQRRRKSSTREMIAATLGDKPEEPRRCYSAGELINGASAVQNGDFQYVWGLHVY